MERHSVGSVYTYGSGCNSPHPQEVLFTTKVGLGALRCRVSMQISAREFSQKFHAILEPLTEVPRALDNPLPPKEYLTKLLRQAI